MSSGATLCASHVTPVSPDATLDASPVAAGSPSTTFGAFDGHLRRASLAVRASSTNVKQSSASRIATSSFCRAARTDARNTR